MYSQRIYLLGWIRPVVNAPVASAVKLVSRTLGGKPDQRGYYPVLSRYPALTLWFLNANRCSPLEDEAPNYRGDVPSHLHQRLSVKYDRSNATTSCAEPSCGVMVFRGQGGDRDLGEVTQRLRGVGNGRLILSMAWRRSTCNHHSPWVSLRPVIGRRRCTMAYNSLLSGVKIPSLHPYCRAAAD